MKRFFPKVLISIGLALIVYVGFSTYSMKNKESAYLDRANQLVNRQKTNVAAASNEKEAQNISESNNVNNDTDAAKNFSVNEGDPAGLIYIPKLERELAIIEGAEEDSLAKGVGHVMETSFPGQNNLIFLAGHRDTVFRDFKNIEVGDEFEVVMPYGKYTYEIRETKIVSKYDVDVIRDMDEEVLIVSTCYPFEYLSSAPDRMLYYSYLKTDA